MALSVFDCDVVKSNDWDFSRCFEERVLLPIPLFLLLLTSLLRIWRLQRQESRERSSRSLRLLLLKEICLGVTIATGFSSLLVILVLQRTVPYLDIAATLAQIPAFYLARLNHLKTRRSSSTLLLFWPIYTLFTAIWTRTVVSSEQQPHDSVRLALRWLYVSTGLTFFGIECLGSESYSELPFEHGRQESPFVTANIFQRWDFSWLTPMMAKGARSYLDDTDLPALPGRDRSKNLGDRLHQAYQKHGKLWKALCVAYGGPFAMAAGLKMIQDGLAFLQPQLLRWLLLYITEYQRARNNGEYTPNPVQGFTIAIIMFLAAICQTIILHQYFQRCFETGMRVRAGLITIIYEKSLRLSNSERGRSTGDIVNLQSVDASKLQDLCTYALIAISGPVQITLAFVSLYHLLGWPAFVGVAIMAASVPLQSVIARYLKRLQERQMRFRDERTRLMSELLANIQSIKLHAWENAFMRRILFVRNDKELRALRKYGIGTAVNTTLWSGIPLLVAFSSFAIASLVFKTPLTSDIIFPAISLFNLLSFPLAMFATVIGNLIESLVSLRRIANLLEAKELQQDARKVEVKELSLGDEAVVISDGEFTWSEEGRQPTLEGVNFVLRKGELMGIWGPVGSGKTSLLGAIIGEMVKLEGKVTVNGSIAYAPQNPWIMSATVKDNILFSNAYDENFYNLVLDACALRPDLKLLADGDQTLVGEKGITLSGGQRARVSLARAVYSRADIILLDDVLAALDSHVARHVMDQVIGHQGILATKARIVVTHSIAHVHEYDTALYLRRGIILDSGLIEHLLSRENSELSKLVRGHSTEFSSGAVTPRSGIERQSSDDDATTAVELATTMTNSSMSIISSTNRRKSFGKSVPVDDLPVKQPLEATKEHREQGQVKLRVYLDYARAASTIAFAVFVLMSVLQQVLILLSNLTLRRWSSASEDGEDRSLHFLLVYGGFCLLGTLAGLISALLIWVFCGLKSARHLHDQMLNALLHAPLSFFQLNPTGRTLNLFTKDTNVLDQVIPRVIQGLVRTMCVTLGILAVVGIAFPLFLVSILPLGWVYLRACRYYLASSRELKRLDAVSRSPIYSWFSESLNGLSTIRAFRRQTVFAKTNQRRLDTNLEAYLPSVSVNRWLSVRLEIVGAVIILVSSCLALVALITSGVDSGLVGLVLSYALSTTSSLNWVVRMISEMETNITSAERVLHATDIQSEAAYEKPETEPTGAWPSQGMIEFNKFSMRYRPELPLVLSNVTVKIEPGQKVGICGRTGSGKSSLLLALFRALEADSGAITIDGVDIASIGLQFLRSNISLVPQSPELFEGTVRFNVEPNEGQTADADIWDALDRARLKEHIESLPGGLDAHVNEGGGSLSSGQRQLLCFARAILRRSKLLILDEATSACDLDTDRCIQDIVTSLDSTLLVVAHRLNTIINYDKILVLDSGRVIEFDTPAALLKDKSSTFYSLAREAGLVE